MRTFRMAHEADAAGLLAIYAPYIATPITFEAEIPGEAEFRARIREIRAFYPYIVAEEGGRILGYAYAHRFRERAAYDWGAELSIYLATDERGRGLGRALYSALIEILRRQGAHMVYGCVTMPNQASIALHEKLGFQRVGAFREAGWKDGRWRDVLWFEKAIGGGKPERMRAADEIEAEDVLRGY